MSHIQLPHALEQYFAYTELARTRLSRRFTITLPYLQGTRLDRLQWWWEVPEAKQQIIGDTGMQELRAQATLRFRRHIERWLLNTHQRLYGSDPIPQLGAWAEDTGEQTGTAEGGTVLPWRGNGRVASG